MTANSLLPAILVPIQNRFVEIGEFFFREYIFRRDLPQDVFRFTNVPASADILTPPNGRIHSRVGIRIWYLRQTGCSNSSLRLRIQKNCTATPLSAATHPSPRNRQILFASRTTSHLTRSRFPQSSQSLPPSHRDPKPPN